MAIELSKENKPSSFLFFCNFDSDYAKTSEIESIISDMNKISIFIRDYEYFNLKMTKNECLKLINKYARHKIFCEQNLTSDFFDKMNFINEFSGLGIHYSYNEYRDFYDSGIELKDLYKILTLDDEFNLFIESFNKNKVHFKNIDQNIYVDKLIYLFNHANLLGLNLDSKVIKRYSIIIKNCASSNELDQFSSGRSIDFEIDPNIILYIETKIDPSWDKFTIARVIYIELGKIFEYNGQVIKYRYRKVNNLINDDDNKIYRSLILGVPSNFTLQNNKLVCFDWANLYAKLLNKYNIECNLIRGSHGYVEFKNNGLIIEADPTLALTSQNDNNKIHDFARIKSGFETAGFIPKNKSKDISYLIKKADEKAGINLNSVDDVYSNLIENYMTVNPYFDSRSKRIIEDFKTANRISNTLKLSDYEYSCCLKGLLKNIYNKVDRQLIYLTKLVDNEKDEPTIYVLAAIETTNGIEYYLSGKETQIKISKVDLERKLNNKELIGSTMYPNIPGITINEIEEIKKY